MARILIIDDAVALRQMLSECLEYEHEVMTAPDGEVGIEIAKTYHPDMVICDLVMPKMNGFAVLKHFQNMPEMMDMPFIFLSGLSDYKTVCQGMTLGADDFLTKPFSVKELLRVVQSRLEKRFHQQSLVYEGN